MTDKGIGSAVGPGDGRIATADQLMAALWVVMAPGYAALERVAERTAVLIAEAGGEASEASLASLESLLAQELPQARIACGMGFVAAPGVVEGHERYLLWLQQRAHGPMRLRLNFDPEDPDVYDYLDMGWFTQAEEGRPRVVFGPYVDYLGSDQYVFTLTVPVMVAGRFCGVVGYDVPADSQEEVLVEVMTRCPVDAVVVSPERRVLAANTGRWVVGSRLNSMPEADGTFVDVAVDPHGTGVHGALARPEADAPA
ncbi:MAG: cache domain-containing protein [Micrococcales bacterium]|nr:cache domain-containing protein [Micrococcales bacterium]